MNSTITLLNTTIIYDGPIENIYDGPLVDTASIVLSVLIVISCCFCCCSCGQGTKSNYSTVNYEENNEGCNYCRIIFVFLLFGLGLNLLIRYENGECDYYSDVSCGGGSTGINRDGVGTSKTNKDKACSYECTLLITFGIIFICTSFLIAFSLTYLYCTQRSNNNNNRKTKIGCDCCHLYV